MAEPAQIVREYLEAWNRRDWEAFRGMLHSKYTFRGGDGQVLEGPDAGVAVGQGWATAFPDGRVEIQNSYSCGDTVAVTEFVARGTNTGPLMGIPPTGKSATIYVANICEVADGKILAEREYLDSLPMLVQLGVIQDPTKAHA